MVMTRSFLECFAGGGMARAGLGPNWQCVFANDIDAKRGASYARNFEFSSSGPMRCSASPPN
jgi:site-specific DNA-cytosine methylase